MKNPFSFLLPSCTMGGRGDGFMAKDIPATIKAARLRAHMTQQELGEKMGYEGEYANVSVRRWETGKCPVPLEKMRALVAALDLTFDDIIP